MSGLTFGKQISSEYRSAEKNEKKSQCMFGLWFVIEELFFFLIYKIKMSLKYPRKQFSEVYELISLI